LSSCTTGSISRTQLHEVNNNNNNNNKTLQFYFNLLYFKSAYELQQKTWRVAVKDLPDYGQKMAEICCKIKNSKNVFIVYRNCVDRTYNKLKIMNKVNLHVVYTYIKYIHLPFHLGSVSLGTTL
jgi:hypothetical protein